MAREAALFLLERDLHLLAEAAINIINYYATLYTHSVLLLLPPGYNFIRRKGECVVYIYITPTRK